MTPPWPCCPPGLTRSGTTLTWSVPTVPVGATAEVTYWAQVNAGARGAILTNTAAAASAGGSCGSACTTTGYTPSWALAKTSDPASGATVHPGDVVGYTLTVTNTGPAVLRGALVDDDLADVLDNATLLAVPGDATLTGTTLRWAVADLAPGASTTLTYRVAVGAGADGVRLANTATPASAGGLCSVSCSTTNQTPAWRLAKTASPGSGSVVEPGDTITYTLTATNTGETAVTGATATDDLAGVLAAADVTITSPQLTRTGAILTWAIPTIATGATATVTYSATVKAAADGATITNAATPNGQGGTCGAGCSTTQTTPGWTLSKTSDAAPGAVLEPGAVITYTLTVRNTGPVALSGASVDDDAGDLVDDAELGVLPAGLSRTGTHLTWAVPTLAVGGLGQHELHGNHQGGRAGRHPEQHRSARHCGRPVRWM